MSATIDYDEWLAELNRLGAENPEGLTMREIAHRRGTCLETARIHMRRAIELGAWEYVGSRLAPGIAGRLSPKPVYRPVQKKRTKG